MNPHGEFTVDGIVAAHLLEEDPIARRDHACEGRSPMLGRLRPRDHHFAVLGDETAGLLPFDSGLALARRGNGRLRHRLGNGLFQHLNGVGIHPEWVRDVAEAGFRDIETFSFDVDLPYSQEAWRGRVRASAPIAATLTPDQVLVFDAEFQSLLAQDFPAEPMLVPHRVFPIVCATPAGRP